MMKLKRCEHCAKYFWYKRSTAKYCGAACRKQANRGVAPTLVYRRLASDTEVFAALLAEHYPRVYRRLETLRDTYGRRAMMDALRIVELTLESDQ